MDETKAWWQSKAVLGGLVAVIAVVLSFFGYDIGGELQGELVENITQGVGVVGGLFALWGRIKATKRIT